MAKKEAALPEKIFVYEEQDGDDKYLCANYSREETVDTEAPRLVGTYRLVETGEVKQRVSYTRK